MDGVILSIHSAALEGHEELQQTGYVNLHEGFLSRFISQKQSGFMFYSITNERTGQTVSAGVREFNAEPGVVIAPWWMLEKIGANEYDQVVIRNVQLPVATRAIFQPMTEDFEKISNPKVVLERALRSHPCLTQGSVIPIYFAGTIYKVRILKTEPSISVNCIKADIECEIAPVETTFEHHWNDPDTDSSDEDSENQRFIAHSIKQPVIKLHKHSTMASRENDLKNKRRYVGVRRYVEGQEILPPKPREKKKEKKEEFLGQWHNLRNETGIVTPKVREYGAQFEEINKEPKEESDKNKYFQGKPRTIGQK